MKYIILSTVLLLVLTSCRNNEVLKAFDQIQENSQVSVATSMEEVNLLMQQVTDSAMANPAKYAGAFNHMNEFHNKTETLLTTIKQVKDSINNQIGALEDNDSGIYAMDEVFYQDDAPTAAALQLKKALENYLITAEDQLYFFPKAEKMAKSSFDTSTATNRDGNDVTWLEYHYKGFPAIASKTKLTLLEQSAYQIESTFLKALLEKPQF